MNYEENYLELGNAVVLRAFADYILACADEICLTNPTRSKNVFDRAKERKWNRRPIDPLILEKRRTVRNECERFFRGEVLSAYTSLPGDFLIKVAWREVNRWVDGEISFHTLRSLGMQPETKEMY